MKRFHALRVASATFAIVAGVLLPATNSSAVVGGVIGVGAYLNFDVEVGIDKATRNFLQGYPETVRKEAVLGANQILERADESVAKIFIQGRDLVMLGKSVVVCAGVSAENIPVGMFRRILGIRPNYTEILKAEKSDLSRGAKVSSTPAELYKQYVDLDNLGRDAICLTIEGDLDHHGVAELRPMIKTTALLWKRLEPLCSNVSECYALVSATVDESLKNALQQDLVKIKAESRLASIVRPPEFRPTLIKSNFDLNSYEQALNFLLAIHDDLIRVSVLRIAKGTEVRSSLIALNHANESSLANSERIGDKVAACNQGYNMASKVAESEKLLAALKSYEILSPEDFEGHAKTVADHIARRQTLISYKASWVTNNGKACAHEPRPVPPRYERQPV